MAKIWPVFLYRTWRTLPNEPLPITLSDWKSFTFTLSASTSYARVVCRVVSCQSARNSLAAHAHAPPHTPPPHTRERTLLAAGPEPFAAGDAAGAADSLDDEDDEDVDSEACAWK